MPTALFLLGVFIVLYVVAGYPLLLMLLSRRRFQPVRKRLGRLPAVSILLPVRNGEHWIKTKLESIRRLSYPIDKVEVIVVCDGCRDGTAEIARNFSLINLRLAEIPGSGKAAALNRAMELATGEILFFTDVRQELDHECLRELVACFEDPRVGAASGELIIRDGETHAEADTGLYWEYEKWIRKRLSRIDSVLGATGAVYAMRASLARPLPPDTILDDVALPLGAFFRGYRVVFDPDARAYDDPASLHTEFGRKVRTLAGVYQAAAAQPALFTRANRMRFHFVSHKLGRQLLPWALLLVLLSAFGLPEPFRAFATVAQAAFYSIAVLDFAVPERSPAKRLTSPVRTFCVLMLAALCAVSYFFVPRRVLWKETRIPARTGAGSAS